MANETQTQQVDQSGGLLDFSWDNGGNESFFGQDGGEVIKEDEGESTLKAITGEEDEEELEEVFKQQVTPPAKPTKKDVKTAKAKAEPEETEEESNHGSNKEEDDDWSFDSSKEDEDVQTVPKDKDKKDSSKYDESAKKGEENAKKDFFTDLALDLKDRGTFQHVDIKEDEIVSEEQFYENFDAEITSRVDDALQSFVEDMGEDGKAYIKFLKDGGNSVDFIRVYGNRTLNIDQFNSDDKDHRRKVLEYYLTSTDPDMTGEEIEDQIESYENSGRAKKLSERYFNRIQQEEEQERADLLKAQEDARAAKEKKIKAFNKEFSETLNKAEEFKGFKFSAEDKKVIANNILKPSVKVGNNQFIPKFNYQLGEILKAATPEAKQKLILLAKLVETDFDMSDYATKVKTEVVKQARGRLAQAKRGVRPSSSGNISSAKTLADYID